MLTTSCVLFCPITAIFGLTATNTPVGQESPSPKQSTSTYTAWGGGTLEELISLDDKFSPDISTCGNLIFTPVSNVSQSSKRAFGELADPIDLLTGQGTCIGHCIARGFMSVNAKPGFGILIYKMNMGE
jgi:hypothetical protein